MFFLHNSFICTTHSPPGSCCPSAHLILAPPKTRGEVCFPFLLQALFEYPPKEEHLPAQPLQGGTGVGTGGADNPCASPISSFTSAGQWQLCSALVAGAAAPLLSTQPVGNRSPQPVESRQDSSSPSEGAGGSGTHQPCMEIQL